MAVTELDVTVRREEPDPDPACDAIQELPGAGTITVSVYTEDGTSGSGMVRSNPGRPDVLGTLIEPKLKPEVVGTNPAFVRHTHSRLLEETEYHGSSRLARFGITAVDTALWDCLGCPLLAALGGSSRRTSWPVC